MAIRAYPQQPDTAWRIGQAMQGLGQVSQGVGSAIQGYNDYKMNQEISDVLKGGTQEEAVPGTLGPGIPEAPIPEKLKPASEIIPQGIKTQLEAGTYGETPSSLDQGPPMSTVAGQEGGVQLPGTRPVEGMVDATNPMGSAISKESMVRSMNLQDPQVQQQLMGDAMKDLQKTVPQQELAKTLAQYQQIAQIAAKRGHPELAPRFLEHKLAMFEKEYGADAQIAKQLVSFQNQQLLYQAKAAEDWKKTQYVQGEIGKRSTEGQEVEIYLGDQANKTKKQIADEQAAEKKRTVVNKDLTRYQDVLAGNSSINTVAGREFARLQQASDTLQLLKDPKIVQNKAATGEAVLSLISTMQGGSSGRMAYQLIQNFMPRSLWGDANTAKQYLSGIPQEYITPENLQNFLHQVTRQQAFWGAGAEKSVKTFRSSLEKYRDPDVLAEFDKSWEQSPVKSYVDAVGGGSSGDTKMINGHPYRRVTGGWALVK